MGDRATLGGAGGGGPARVTGVTVLRPDQVPTARARATSINVGSILGGSVRVVNGQAQLRLRTSAGTAILTAADLRGINSAVTAGGGARVNTSRGQLIISDSPQRRRALRAVSRTLLQNARVLQRRADAGAIPPPVFVRTR